jgi:DNA-binding response OmpR family regulator
MVQRTGQVWARALDVADEGDEAVQEVSVEADRPTNLVVEDNPALLTVLGMLLEFEQYHFALMADGQEALDWLACRRPALVILDWILPTAGGSLVLDAVRALYGPQVPVLVLSAVAGAGEAREAGADGYLRKPYAVEQLVDTIHHLLRGQTHPSADP